MRVVAFNGSPRANGNTDILLRTVLTVIEAEGIEARMIHIGSHALRGCTGCRKCQEHQNKQCVITSDPMNDYIAAMCEADAILLGSPTYFANVTTEMKAFIDRAGYVALMNGRCLARKIGASVVAVRRGGAVPAFDAMNHFFQINGMIVPGSTYWNFGIGRMPGEVSQDEEALANMRDLGSTIAWLLKKLHA